MRIFRTIFKDLSTILYQHRNRFKSLCSCLCNICFIKILSFLHFVIFHIFNCSAWGNLNFVEVSQPVQFVSSGKKRFEQQNAQIKYWDFGIVWRQQQFSSAFYYVDLVSSVIIAFWFISNFFWQQISLNCHMKLFFSVTNMIKFLHETHLSGARNFTKPDSLILSHINRKKNIQFSTFTLFRKTVKNNRERYGQFSTFQTAQ